MSDLDLLHFPSGRSVGNCRKDAKRLSRKKQISLNQALDQIAEENGVSLPWGKAMALVKIEPATKPGSAIPQMTRADILAVMERYPYLTHFGMGIYMRGLTSGSEFGEKFVRERERLLGAEDECNKALRFLMHTTKRKTVNTKRSSYGLKHRVEFYMKHLPDVSNYYIANGAFICAAVHAGFDIRAVRTGSPNVHINISEKSPIFLWEKLTARSPSFGPEAEHLAALRQLVGVTRNHANVSW